MGAILALVPATPAEATTTQNSIFCNGWTVWQTIVHHRYYDGSGQLRARVDSVKIDITSPGGQTVQGEYRIRMITTTGTAWDTGYQVSGAIITPDAIFNQAAPSAANSLVSRGPYVRVDAGAYNDGAAACMFHPVTYL